MKFIVRVKAHLDEAEEYEATDTYDLINQLLEEWVDGDADMPGAFAFLAENGHNLGITDADVDEGTDSDLLQEAADLIRGLFGPPEARSLEQLALFLAAISGEYTIEGDVSDKEEAGAEEDKMADASEEADEEELNEEYEKLLDEDYDY